MFCLELRGYAWAQPSSGYPSTQHQSGCEARQATATTVLPRDNVSNSVRSQETLDSGFIKEEQHPDWVAYTVPVTKKNGKIRFCIDFCDLNQTCPKVDFPLPIMDVMRDNTCEFEQMPYMDGFSGYNQIKMYPDDEKYTSFRTPLGVYVYTVMLFRLKNARATYQRAMNTIFHEHICKTVACYVDDIAVKSRAKGTIFHEHIMRAQQLKMNPTKSFLGQPAVNSLGLS